MFAMVLRWINTSWDFVAIFQTGDSFWHFLFAFLHAKHLLISVLLYKDFASFEVEPFSTHSLLDIFFEA